MHPLTTPQRSRMMSSIRGKNTLPERKLRSLLFAKGFRYRLHAKKLPGSPDLTLRKYRAVIFVHGCFWHRHESCRYTTTPKTNKEFWLKKFQENVERDRRHIEILLSLGWRVAIVWECALKHSAESTAQMIKHWLHSKKKVFVISEQQQSINLGK